MAWTFKPVEKKLPELKNIIFIEGLPGIGNVGKVAVDFIVDKTKAKKLYEITSYTMPHSVFVNEKNMIEMPSIELYYAKLPCKEGKECKDIVFLTGDVQPIDEVSCYEFCDALLDILQKMGCKEIITTGGIGLQEVPKTPKVYITGNSKELVKKYIDGTSASDKIFGVVGPIVGVTGLLLGLAERRDIPAIALLAETLGHPMYLGIKGAREELKILDAKLGLKLDLKELDKEIKSLESEIMRKTKELSQVSKETALKKIEGKFGKDVTYIG
jgi:uncharacterized protein